MALATHHKARGKRKHVRRAPKKGYIRGGRTHRTSGGILRDNLGRFKKR